MKLNKEIIVIILLFLSIYFTEIIIISIIINNLKIGFIISLVLTPFNVLFSYWLYLKSKQKVKKELTSFQK